MKKVSMRLASGFMGILLGFNLLFSSVSYAKEDMTTTGQHLDLDQDEALNEYASDSASEGVDIIAPSNDDESKEKSGDSGDESVSGSGEASSEGSLEASTDNPASEDASLEDSSSEELSLTDESDEASSEDSLENILDEELTEEAAAESSDAASLLLSDEENLLESESKLLDSSSDPYSGSCGVSATWKFDPNSGVLTISGSGAMDDYEIDNPRNYTPSVTAPWFQYAESIKDVVISDDITYIGEASFVKLKSNQKEFRLPSKLKGLGKYAFMRFNCNNFYSPKFIVPGTVTDIPDYCFFQTRVSGGEIVLEEGVKSVGAHSFENAGSEIVLPDSLTTVGEEAFCSASSPQTYSIPKGIKKVEKKGFYHLQHVKVLIFEGDMPQMEEAAFGYNSVIAYYNPKNKGFSDAERQKASQYFEDVTWKAIGTNIDQKAGPNITWSYDETTQILRFDGSGPMYDYTSSNLPDWYTHANRVSYWYFDPRITEIGDYCFYRMGDFRAGVNKGNNNNPVILPKKLTRIGRYAFGHTNFYNLTMAEEVEKIEEGAFYGDSLSLFEKTIIFPKKVKYIGDKAFYQCKLKNAYIDLSLIEYIGESGLDFSSDSDNVTASFEFPDSLKYIGDNGFDYVTPTSSKLRLPSGITYVGKNAFRGCSGLKGEILFPSSVTEFKSSTFSKTAIESIKFDKTLKNVELYAFDDMSSLKKLTFTGSFPNFDENLFRKIENKLTVYYPFDDDTWYEGIKGLDYNSEIVQFVPTGNSTTVTFVDFNGKVYSTQSVAPNAKVKAPSVTTLNGKKVGGWYTNKTLQYDVTRWNFDTPVKNRIILYAGEEYTGYRVVFYPKNGQDPIIRDVKKGDCAKEEVVKRDGYRFYGWYEKNSASIFSFKTPLDKDVTLYASWGKYRPYVNFISNGYDYIPKRTINCEVGTKFSDIQGWTSDYEKDGYAKFLGWYTDEKLTKPVPNNFIVNEDVTVYGKWTVVNRKVTLDYGDESLNTVVNVPYKNHLRLPEKPQRKGFSFEGWYYDKECKQEILFETLYDVTEDMTVYALWTPMSITIHFSFLIDSSHQNWGTYEYIKAGQPISEATGKITSESYPYGYKLEGYYYDAKCTKKVSENDLVYEDATIYVKFGIKTYKVTINPDNGEKPYTIEVQHGMRPNVVNPVKKGYELTGWNNGEYTFETIPTISSDCTFTARWSSSGYSQDLKISGVSDMPYTGKAVTLPNLKLKDNTYELINGKDYTVKYSNNVNAGLATLTITYKGLYKGKSVVNFNILKGNLGKLKNSGEIVTSFDTNYLAYNKKVQKVKPAITFISGSRKVTLKENKDYKLVFEHSDKNADGYDPDAFKNPGKYTIKVLGMGSFEGSFALSEVITEDKLVSKLSIVGLKKSYSYTGEEIRPSFTVKYGKEEIGKCDEKGFSSKSLNCKFESNKDLGTAKIILTAKEKSGYAGSRSLTFNITGTPISKAVFDNFVTSMEYDGKAKKQSAILYKNAASKKAQDISGGALQEGIDYSVDYQNNIDVGTATVIYIGMKGYSGSVKKTFKITGKDFKKVSVSSIPNYTFTGSAIIPDLIIIDSSTGKMLSGIEASSYASASQAKKRNYDYVISYSGNINKGTAKVTLEGVNLYRGKIIKTFKINPVNISEVGKLIISTSAPYTKKGCRPSSISVKVPLSNGKQRTLKEDIDYKVSITNNKKAGQKAQLTVTGMGNYAGKLTETFDVTVRAISQCHAVVTKAPYKNRVGNFVCSISVYDTDWVKLTQGVDYKVTYTRNGQILNPKKDKLKSGDSFNYKIEGLNNFENPKSSQNGYFTLDSVAEKNGDYNPTPALSSCKISIRDYTYTGRAIEPYKSNITVIDKAGNRVNSNSYQIVGYENNVNVGTATIILRGNVEFTGQYKLKFKILPRTVEEDTTSIK